MRCRCSVRGARRRGGVLVHAAGAAAAGGVLRQQRRLPRVVYRQRGPARLLCRAGQRLCPGDPQKLCLERSATDRQGTSLCLSQDAGAVFITVCFWYFLFYSELSSLLTNRSATV